MIKNIFMMSKIEILFNISKLTRMVRMGDAWDTSWGLPNLARGAMS